MKKLFLLFMVILFPLIIFGNEPEINDSEKKDIKILLTEFVNVENAKVISYYIEDILETEEVLIEDWMYEDNYLQTENIPIIEDWMFDEDYFLKGNNS